MFSSKVFTLTQMFLAFVVLQGVSFPRMAAAQPPEAPRRFAIIIGNGEYQGLNVLRNPVRDAELVATKAQELGFEVELLRDSPKYELDERLRAFTQRAYGADAILFYYSGHAMQTGGENYLFGIDATKDKSPDLTLQGIDLGFIVSTLSRGSQTSIFLLDSCRDDPTRPRTRDADRIAGGLAPINANVGTFIGFATAPGSVALDGPGANGPFAAAIGETDARRYSSIVDFFIAVTKRTYEISGGRQRPWFNASLIEPFFFFEPIPQAPTAIAPPDVVAIVDDKELSKQFGDGPIKADDRLLGTFDEKSNAIKVMGKSDDAEFAKLRPGLNLLESAGKRFWAWYEGKRLAYIAEPYKKSYALIFGIGNYPESVRAAGYDNLPLITKNADKLKEALAAFDFPLSNVDVISDSNVTRDRIESELQRFWTGGDRADADRLFIYFGGHGDVANSTILNDAGQAEQQMGYYVTHDFDPKKPVSSSFLLDDLRSKHFPLMRPKHIMIVVDACAAGLVVRSMSASSKPENLAAFQRLARLREELDGVARNILVAGTDSKATYYDEIGGSYLGSQLIRALQDEKADFNNDKILTFDEIFKYARDNIIPLSQMNSVRQSPQRFMRADRNVIFLRQ